MRDTGGDWTRRHARLDVSGESDGSDSGDRVVKAEPPADDWDVRHAWCRR